MNIHKKINSSCISTLFVFKFLLYIFLRFIRTLKPACQESNILFFPLLTKHATEMSYIFYKISQTRIRNFREIHQNWITFQKWIMSPSTLRSIDVFNFFYRNWILNWNNKIFISLKNLKHFIKNEIIVLNHANFSVKSLKL